MTIGTKRKPLAVSQCVDTGTTWSTTAICDDGSIWGLTENKWERLPDIPQIGDNESDIIKQLSLDMMDLLKTIEDFELTKDLNDIDDCGTTLKLCKLIPKIKKLILKVIESDPQ